MEMGLNRANIGSSKYHQGRYRLIHPDKYIGDPGDVIYRSGLELQFMRFCDNSSFVTKWGSEVIIIPYTDHENKTRKYYPDFYMEVRNPAALGMESRYVVEVKPWQETQKPVVPDKATLSKLRSLEYQLKMYRKNMFKWSKAIEWSKARGMEFKIITEKNMQDLRHG